jgi:hypothetical protein
MKLKFYLLGFIALSTLSTYASELQEECGKVKKIEALVTSSRFTLENEQTGAQSTYGMKYMDDPRTLVVAAFANDLRLCVTRVEPTPEGEIRQAMGIRLSK